MRKFFFIIGFILILVSIYWFQPAMAQTVEEVAKNRELYQKYLKLKNQPSQSADAYNTPPIFEEHQRRARGITDLSVGAQTETVSETVGAPVPAPALTLRPFGVDLFAQDAEVSSPSELGGAEDYTLGSGDNLLIYLWGRVEKEYNLTVDREGKIFVPKVGDMYVAGQRLDELKKTLMRKLSTVYSEFQATVTLGKIRTNRVYVIGEVRRPGAYTVNALTTVFNALYLAGGPTERGSLRRITLLRNEKSETTIDLYDFLIKGINSGDVRLHSGDAIFVPVVGAQAQVSGEVKRPAIYELSDGETIGNLLELAGGNTPTGHLATAILERVGDGNEPYIVDVDLSTQASESAGREPALNGDHLRVRSVYDIKRNFVIAAGMVRHPGVYQRDKTMTVRDLVSAAQLRGDSVHLARANVFRTWPDGRREALKVNLASLISEDSALSQAADIQLCDRDSLHVYAVRDVVREKYVTIDGEVKRPGKYPLYDGLSVKDLIFLAGDVTRAAYATRAEIARLDAQGVVSVAQVDLIGPAGGSFALAEDDQVFVRRLPEWREERTVIIRGEVMFPGIYTLTSTEETLYQTLMRAGWLTPSAFPMGLVLERRSIDSTLKSRRLDQVIAATTELREDSLGRVTQDAPIQLDQTSLSRIVIDMKRLLTSKGKEGDVALEPGDMISVPHTPSGVTALGAVGAPGTIKFVPGKKIDYYIQRAGGYTRQADKNELRIVRADGRVYSGGEAHQVKVELGDIALTPVAIKKDRDTLKSLSSIFTMVTGMATSAYILTKL